MHLCVGSKEGGGGGRGEGEGGGWEKEGGEEGGGGKAILRQLYAQSLLESSTFNIFWQVH